MTATFPWLVEMLHAWTLLISEAQACWQNWTQSCTFIHIVSCTLVITWCATNTPSLAQAEIPISPSVKSTPVISPIN